MQALRDFNNIVREKNFLIGKLNNQNNRDLHKIMIIIILTIPSVK